MPAKQLQFGTDARERMRTGALHPRPSREGYPWSEGVETC